MVNLKNIPFILFSIIIAGQVLVGQSRTKPITQVVAESQTGVSDQTLKKIVASLRQQESRLKNDLSLHYTITEKPSEAVIQKNRDQIEKTHLSNSSLGLTASANGVLILQFLLSFVFVGW